MSLFWHQIWYQCHPNHHLLMDNILASSPHHPFSGCSYTLIIEALTPSCPSATNAAHISPFPSHFPCPLLARPLCSLAGLSPCPLWVALCCGLSPLLLTVCSPLPSRLKHILQPGIPSPPPSSPALNLTSLTVLQTLSCLVLLLFFQTNFYYEIEHKNPTWDVESNKRTSLLP